MIEAALQQEQTHTEQEVLGKGMQIAKEIIGAVRWMRISC